MGQSACESSQNKWRYLASVKSSTNLPMLKCYKRMSFRKVHKWPVLAISARLKPLWKASKGRSTRTLRHNKKPWCRKTTPLRFKMFMANSEMPMTAQVKSNSRKFKNNDRSKWCPCNLKCKAWVWLCLRHLKVGEWQWHLKAWQWEDHPWQDMVHKCKRYKKTVMRRWRIVCLCNRWLQSLEWEAPPHPNSRRSLKQKLLLTSEVRSV